jgi:hypothetical protein
VARDVDYYADAYDMVVAFFHGDDEKATIWMEARNPLLGGMTPTEMVRIGQGEKLLEFIRGATAASQPPAVSR